MGRYRLTNYEREMVCKFRNYSIPYIFKSGEYCGYMQYFEFIDFEICYLLLNGKPIGESNYKIIFSEELDDNKKIQRDKLDKNALDFYNLYLSIEEIVKKYYK